MKHINKVEQSTKDLVKSRINKLKTSITKFDLPKVSLSECLYINGKYYNVII